MGKKIYIEREKMSIEIEVSKIKREKNEIFIPKSR
jgi:hypothetical protein